MFQIEMTDCRVVNFGYFHITIVTSAKIGGQKGMFRFDFGHKFNMTVVVIGIFLLTPVVCYGQSDTVTVEHLSEPNVHRIDKLSPKASKCEHMRVRSELARNGTRAADFGWKKIDEKNPVIVLGEAHGLGLVEQKVLIGRKLKQVSDKKRCLLLEVPSVWSRSDLSNRLVEMQKNGSPTASDFLDVIEGYEKLGYQIHFVDHRLIAERHKKQNKLPNKKRARDPEEKDQIQEFNSRDLAMSNNILRLHKTGQCEASVFLVGKSHWSTAEEGRLTVRQQLGGKIRVTSFNLINSNDDVKPVHFHEWRSLCRSEAFIPRDSVIFRNSSIGDSPILINSPGVSGVFGDYDYTLLK